MPFLPEYGIGYGFIQCQMPKCIGKWHLAFGVNGMQVPEALSKHDKSNHILLKPVSPNLRIFTREKQVLF
jgi:hypothetical protein